MSEKPEGFSVSKTVGGNAVGAKLRDKPRTATYSEHPSCRQNPPEPATKKINKKASAHELAASSVALNDTIKTNVNEGAPTGTKKNKPAEIPLDKEASTGSTPSVSDANSPQPRSTIVRCSQTKNSTHPGAEKNTGSKLAKITGSTPTDLPVPRTFTQTETKKKQMIKTEKISSSESFVRSAEHVSVTKDLKVKPKHLAPDFLYQENQLVNDRTKITATTNSSAKKRPSQVKSSLGGSTRTKTPTDTVTVKPKKEENPSMKDETPVIQSTHDNHGDKVPHTPDPEPRCEIVREQRTSRSNNVPGSQRNSSSKKTVSKLPPRETDSSKNYVCSGDETRENPQLGKGKLLGTKRTHDPDHQKSHRNNAKEAKHSGGVGLHNEPLVRTGDVITKGITTTSDSEKFCLSTVKLEKTEKVEEKKTDSARLSGVKRKRDTVDISPKIPPVQVKRSKFLGNSQNSGSEDKSSSDNQTIVSEIPQSQVKPNDPPEKQLKPGPSVNPGGPPSKKNSQTSSTNEKSGKTFDIRKLAKVPRDDNETPAFGHEEKPKLSQCSLKIRETSEVTETASQGAISTPLIRDSITAISDTNTETNKDGAAPRDNIVEPQIVTPVAAPVPKKRGRPRLNPERKAAQLKKSTQDSRKRGKTKSDASQQIGNLANVVAHIGSTPVGNIQKELLSGASPEEQTLVSLCLRYMDIHLGLEQTRHVTKKVLRVLGAIRRKSSGREKLQLDLNSEAGLNCIAYVGEVPKSLQEKGVQPVSIEEVKSWYRPEATDKELTTNITYHEGTYRIAIRPEVLRHFVSDSIKKIGNEVNVKVPLPPGSAVSSMSDFISKVNRINPQKALHNEASRDMDTKQQIGCPGPQHKNWLPDTEILEEEFKKYVAGRATYYETIYQESEEEHCDNHVSQPISRSHVNAMLKMPVEQFLKICSNNERCETYKLGLLHPNFEPFVGMAYLSPLELEHAMEMRVSPIEEGLCYLCILSCYTSQYAQNSAAGSSTRIKVPFQHIQGIPGEYVPQAMIAQTTGMTNGLLTPLRSFCVNDYIPITTEVTTSSGRVVPNVRAFEEKGHLVFRYSSRNPQPLSTDPQKSYTVSCAHTLTTCYLLRETLSSGVTSRLQTIDIVDLYLELGFIKKSYSSLIIGPSSANPSGETCLIDKIFVAPPKSTRRRSVTIKTKTGPDRRNTQLSSSSVSNILLSSGTPRSSRDPLLFNRGSSGGGGVSSVDISPPEGDANSINYSTFNGRPFDVVFSDSISTTMKFVDQLCSLFGYKQSGVDGTPIIRYPFVSLYDDKDIETKRSRAYTSSLKSVHRVKKQSHSGGELSEGVRETIDDNIDIDGDGEDSGVCGDENDDGQEFDEGQEMFFLEDYKFYHSVMVRLNVAYSIIETISRPGGLAFSEVLEVLDKLADPHRDTQANKESQESRDLKERIKLYDKLPRKYVIQKLVQFIDGHRNVLEFFHKYSAISDEELCTVNDNWVYIPSKVKEWRSLMTLLEPKIPYKYDKLDENRYNPDIFHHEKPPPRECVTRHLNESNTYHRYCPASIPCFERFEDTRYKFSLLSQDDISREILKCRGFPHWNPQHLSSQLFGSTGGASGNESPGVCSDLRKSTIYITLLLRLHYAYELMQSLENQADAVVTKIIDFVTSSFSDPEEDYDDYSLADEHFRLIDPYERIPGCEGDITECDPYESDFFRVFYTNDLDKYRSGSFSVNIDSPNTVNNTHERQRDTKTENSLNATANETSGGDSIREAGEGDSIREAGERADPKNNSSGSDDQFEPWMMFSKSLLAKSSRGRHHVYLLRRELLSLREIIYQIRAFICTHIYLASYLHTSGLVLDDDIISDEIISENGAISKFLIYYPDDHRFYGEGSQPDCVASHMYVNFFAHQGTENRVWYYLIGKLLPRCCQSRKWGSKHEAAGMTHESYRLWVCMCLRVSLTGMYRSRRQWLKFSTLLKMDNTCKLLFDDKQLFLSFQKSYPGLVMTSLRESMIWQIGKNPALLRVYLEYFQQWRSFSFTVKRKMEYIGNISNASGRLCDISGIIDQLFSGSRFVFRRVCFGFVPFILSIFKEINGSLLDDTSKTPREQSSKRKTPPKTTRKSTRKSNFKPPTSHSSDTQRSDDHYEDSAITITGVDDLNVVDDDDFDDFSRRRKSYYPSSDSVGTTQSRPEPLDDRTIRLIDMFIEFMNPHDDIDLRSLSMIGLSSEGIDNLHFIYTLFIAGEQNRSSATMLKQMNPRDYEISFYFFTAFRRHLSIIAIPCDGDTRRDKLSGIRWKYAINENGKLPDASTAIVFSQCCSLMKSLPQSGEGPRYYGHARIVYSEESGTHVCWAKREKGTRKRAQKQSQSIATGTTTATTTTTAVNCASPSKKRATSGNDSSTPPPPRKYAKINQKNLSEQKNVERKDRYDKICGKTAVIAIPGTYVVQHDPIKEKPNPISYTICPGKKCGGITPFSLSMWGPNGFTCTICDKADRENLKIPRCDICQAVKKRSQSWVQPFMYDNIPGTGRMEQYLICPFCARKCGMDDRPDSNRNKTFVHDMTFFECQALVERVVKVENREQQFAWEHWKPRRINKQQKQQQQQQQHSSFSQQDSKKKVTRRTRRRTSSNPKDFSKSAAKQLKNNGYRSSEEIVDDDLEDFDHSRSNIYGDPGAESADELFDKPLPDDEGGGDDFDNELGFSESADPFSQILIPRSSGQSVKVESDIPPAKKTLNNNKSKSLPKKPRFSTRIGRMYRKRKI